MGKRYRCEYCDKTMSAAPSIIKTHNKGMGHQKLVQEHYQQYKDPETILNEEKFKKPCLRHTRGECAFGYMCKFSHYSQEELNGLQRQVDENLKENTDISQLSFQDLYQELQGENSSKTKAIHGDDTVIYDSQGVTHILPWTYNSIFDGYGDNLPPSVKKIKLDDFADAVVTEWG